MKITENASLKPYNTFGIDVKTPKFIEVSTLDDLKKAVSEEKKYFVLGGGSNILFTKDLEIPVLRIDLRGIEVIKEDDDFVWVEAKAGEIWHHFVLYTLEKGWGGLENLSLIPGSVGATPVQNIGAYGVEIKDVMISCKTLNVNTLEERVFTTEECDFGYRESIFKGKEKGNFIITSVTYKLTKRNHNLHLNYGVINSVLSEKGIEIPTPKDISEAVISIRESKLPNPKSIGNCGSFFKNPVVGTQIFKEIYSKNPQMPHYILSDDEVKIPAGWLIEKSGLKGYRKGDAGVHSQQALVIVNYGKATGKELLEMAHYVLKTVKEKFNISLEMEVNTL